MQQLSRRLAASGIRTWLDTEQIVGGEWKREIKRSLRRCNLFLASLIRNTIERGEVLQFELDSALEIQKSSGSGSKQIFVLLVRLQPCEIPESLRDLQTIDLYAESRWLQLLRALRHDRRPFPMLKSAAVLAGRSCGCWGIHRTPSGFGGIRVARCAR